MNYAVAMRRSKGKRKSKSWENDYDANRTCSTYFQGKKASSSAVGYEFISFGTIIGFVCLCVRWVTHLSQVERCWTPHHAALLMLNVGSIRIPEYGSMKPLRIDYISSPK